MACDCIDKFNATLADDNVQVERQSVCSNFGQSNEVRSIRAKLATSKISASSRRKTPVFATFCPFCGERYVPLTPEAPHGT